MNTEESNATCSDMPAGSVPCRRASSALAALATESVLAVDCLTTPRPTAELPLTRSTLRSSRAPRRPRRGGGGGGAGGPAAVDPQAHGVAPLAADDHRGDAGQRLHAVGDIAVGVIRELERRVAGAPPAH